MAVNNQLNLGVNPLVVEQGGTGINSTTAFALIAGGTTSTGPLQSLASVGTAGQALISNGPGVLPSFASVVPGIQWFGIAGTSQAAAVGSGYVVQNAALTTVTLPATAPLGSIVHVQGLGAGGWVLAANVGQTIKIGAATTTSGGSLASTDQWDCVNVVCVVADTTWAVTFTLSSGLTIA
jgi:3D (Asp-Asp-Asp) domain-containing protein